MEAKIKVIGHNFSSTLCFLINSSVSPLAMRFDVLSFLGITKNEYSFQLQLSTDLLPSLKTVMFKAWLRGWTPLGLPCETPARGVSTLHVYYIAV
jgi:hypothetical protein